LEWKHLFVLPLWLKVWWESFGSDTAPHICVVRNKERIVGIAPLSVQGAEAGFLGNPDVCDYQDVIVVPGMEHGFSSTLVAYLKQKGVNRLNLCPLREDSTVRTRILHTVQSLGCDTFCEPDDVSYEMELPETWDGFLGRLTGKQRHEVRRKLRRLEAAGAFTYRSVEDIESVKEALPVFFELFQKNRRDKAEFMTPKMTAFFKSLAEAFAEIRILRLFFLELDGVPAAAVMCFDYGGVRYLYNNGYDQHYRSLSIGVMSKVLCIKDAIENNMKVYNFLKGSENYKHHLGGQTVQLYRCRIQIR
jgi:CelD/BcsL family acetyltransferase involved in cellulose biosynthesis